MEITSTISIPDDEISLAFIQSAGPGGQNINKVASAVQLRFNVKTTSFLSEEIKLRLVKLAGARISKQGVLEINSRRYRTRERNREAIEQRFRDLIKTASLRPKIRYATKPGLAAREERVHQKKKRAEVKKQRRFIGEL
jgi:ribosome-associated protein